MDAPVGINTSGNPWGIPGESRRGNPLVECGIPGNPTIRLMGLTTNLGVGWTAMILALGFDKFDDGHSQDRIMVLRETLLIIWSAGQEKEIP
eukprot:577510-Amorphochlora_amoeboformis.AAC.1